VTNSTPTEDSLIGVVLAERYKVLERIGEGGMGSVYVGQHVTLGKRVALKVLKQEMCHDKTIVERFFREARATSSIEHENVVEISDFGVTPSGSAFFVMEFLRGQELAQLMEDAGAIPWARAKNIILQVARALAAAHENGIVHRDMKPGNVFLISRGGRDDFVKVLDFGIAKIDHEAALTRAGMVFGTASYMAPEQATGLPVDGRADMYALACLAFELLTGRLPFTATHPIKMLNCHIREPAPSLRTVAPELGIPEAVDVVILRALNKRPDDRFKDMHAFAEALAVIPAEPVAAAPAPTPAAIEPTVRFDPKKIEEQQPEVLVSREVDQCEQTEPRMVLFPEHGGPPRAVDPATMRKRPPRPQPRKAPVMSSPPAIGGEVVPFPPEIPALAWLFVGLVETAAGHLGNDDLLAAAKRYQRWAPELPLEQIAALIRHTIADYRALADPGARSQRTHEHAVDLRNLLPREKLAEVLAVMYEIASEDGLVRDQELRYIVTVTQQLGLTPDPRLLAIAFLYLTLGYADGHFDESEKIVLREQAKEWAPHVSVAERAVVIRWAVAEFKRRPTAEARMQCAREAADQLRANSDIDTLRRILADLWRIAGADGHISPEEQAFISEIVRRFGLG
jgi:serine/threonine protein kinase/tellurite resistance protein